MDPQVKLVSLLYRLFIIFAIVGFPTTLYFIFWLADDSDVRFFSDGFGLLSDNLYLWVVVDLVMNACRYGVIILGAIGAFVFQTKSKRLFSLLASILMVGAILSPVIFLNFGDF